jgi:hypothetical protein
MMRAMVGSAFIKDLLALFQYSGFMERQIQQEVLRLHAPTSPSSQDSAR